MGDGGEDETGVGQVARGEGGAEEGVEEIRVVGEGDADETGVDELEVFDGMTSLKEKVSEL